MGADVEDVVDDADVAVEDGAPVEGTPDAAPPSEAEGQAEGQAAAPEEVPASVDWESRIAGWGGEQFVTEAVALSEALGTPEGVRALFEEAGKAIGVGSDKLDELLGRGATEAQPQPYADILGDDPDRPLTAAEVVKLMEQVAKDQVTPVQEQLAKASEQARVERVQGYVTQAMDKIGVTDAKQAEMVLKLADNYITEDDLDDPDKVRSAIQSGFSDWKQVVAQAHEKYVSEKREQAEKQPKRVTGSTGGGEATPPPASVAEASRRVREMLFRNN